MDLARGILRGAFVKQEGELAPVDRDELNTFCSRLDQIIQNSSTESTECIVWTLANVAPSASRSAALGKYLLKLVESESRRSSTSHVTYSGTGDPRRQRNSQSNGTSEKAWYTLVEAGAEVGAAGVALTILLFLDSVFNAIMACSEGDKGSDKFAPSIKTSIMALIQSAAVEEGKQALDLYQALYQVVSWYKADSTFDNFEIMEMRGLVRSRYDNWLQWLEKSDSQAYQKLNRKNEHSRSMSDLPRHHGNRNDQWHQQPAGTIFQLIHGQDPISTERIRPIMMSSKTIDPELVDIVNEHIREGERTYSLTKVSPYLDDGDVQLNSLGFRVQKDVRTGKRKVTETYYGHGSGHLERLKRRKMGAAAISRPPPTPAPPAQQNNPMPNPPAAAVNMPTPPPPVLQQTNRIASDLHPTRAAGAPPPPPPPTATAASPPFPFQLPPRPPNWTGLWPPPPPGGNMAGAPPPPPPPSASHSPPNGAYGYQRGDSHGHSGGYDRSHYGPRDSFHGGTPRGRGGYGRGRGHW